MRKPLNLNMPEKGHGYTTERRRRIAAGTWVHAGQQTSCHNGHPLDEENTYWRGDRRQCRACDRERHRASYEPQPVLPDLYDEDPLLRDLLP